jgi:hypothetical protein
MWSQLPWWNVQASEDLQRASLGLYDDDTGPFPISDQQVVGCAMT